MSDDIGQETSTSLGPDEVTRVTHGENENPYGDSYDQNNTYKSHGDNSADCDCANGSGNSPPRIFLGEPDVSSVSLETIYFSHAFYTEDPFRQSVSHISSQLSIEISGSDSATITQFPSYYFYTHSVEDEMAYNISPWREKQLDPYSKNPTPPHNLSIMLQQLEDLSLPSNCAITRTVYQHCGLPICLAVVQLEFVQENVETFLSRIQLPALIPTFKAQDITALSTLRPMTTAHFEEMRISIGNRIKLTNALSLLPQTQSIPPTTIVLKDGDIDTFLGRIQLSSLIPSFTSQDITSLSVMKALQPKDFTDLGISIGNRIKIQEALGSVVIADSPPSPPHSPPVLAMPSARTPSPSAPSPISLASATHFILSATTPPTTAHAFVPCVTPLHSRTRDVSPPPANIPTSSAFLESSSTASCSAASPGQNMESVILTGVVVDYSRPLGKGSFGTVWMGTWFGSIVAVKQVLATSELVKEVDVNRRLNHPNCLRYYGVWYNNNVPHMVLEFMDGGDLHTFLRNKKKSGGSFLTPDLLQMARDAACGMMAMEEQHIVHRDLAARNLLVSKTSEGFVVKVGDFGLSRPTVDGIYEASKSKFPVRWTAPECAVDKKFTTMSDIWSYAVTLWEIFTHGEIPYSNLSNDKVLAAIQTGTRLVMPQNCPLAVYHLMKLCWDISPHHRPTFRSIFNTLTEVMAQLKTATTVSQLCPGTSSLDTAPPNQLASSFNSQLPDPTVRQPECNQLSMSSSPALATSTPALVSLSTTTTTTSTTASTQDVRMVAKSSPNIMASLSDQQSLSQRPLSKSITSLQRPTTMLVTKDPQSYARPVYHVPYVSTSTVPSFTSSGSSSNTTPTDSTHPLREMGNKERDLFKWAQTSRFDLLEKLIRNEFGNLNLEARTELGNTFLHYLAALRHIDEKNLNFLELYCGHIFQLGNDKKETPLHIACLSKNKVLIQFLVRQHCDPEAKTDQGLTCYDYALQDEAIIQYLDSGGVTQHCSVDPSRAATLGIELPPPFAC
ncbi:tyrosine-protein kinase TXK [Pelomyxa schiedti]|nr:tyrosine-protein kinase TXK [Pelomyxa schiedti]